MPDLVRHFFGGFVRLHALYHANKQPICGVEIAEELSRHGYALSPGTLYPVLHQLERAGHLSCRQRVVSGKRRKYYRITARGKKVLRDARSKLAELVSEVLEDRDRMVEATRAKRRGLRRSAYRASESTSS